MLFEYLATELVTQIYLSCASVTDALALSATCHRFHDIYSGSRKLSILETAAEAQFGPLGDLTQLLTHNASQPAHIARSVPFSIALLRQMVHAGRIAEKWCDVYPFERWREDFELRRLLTSEERYRLRRAIYRLWLYSRAFHNSDHPRELRATKLVIQKRARLLHNWSSLELAEITDVFMTVKDMVQSTVCPSNSTIARNFKKRYPDNNHHLLFNTHFNRPSPPQIAPANNPFTTQYNHTLSSYLNSTQTYNSRYAGSRYSLHPNHEVGAEGWGDDIPHYYVVQDMLKLDPEQVMWLKENAPLKSMVEGYVRTLGSWFDNNGQTWVETLQWVIDERCEDMNVFMKGILDGETGIARG